jgi:hypothetical protein
MIAGRYKKPPRVGRQREELFLDEKFGYYKDDD